MQKYRCPNGHVTELDFGDAFKKECPSCQIMMFKYRDIVGDAAENPAVIDAAEPDKNTNLRKAVAAALTGVTLIAVVWGYIKHTAPPELPVAQKPVLPVSSAKTGASAPAKKNVVSEVAISGFEASANEQGVVVAKFMLTNNGGQYNDYPSLRVHWKNSTAPDTVIGNTAYVHPDGPFTQVNVTTELSRPADATGVEVTVQY